VDITAASDVLQRSLCCIGLFLQVIAIVIPHEDWDVTFIRVRRWCDEFVLVDDTARQVVTAEVDLLHGRYRGCVDDRLASSTV